MLNKRPVHVDVGKGKLAGAVVVMLVSVVFGGAVVLAVVLGAEVVVLGGVGVFVLAAYVHWEHWARTVRLLGEQTSKGTWASAQMKAQQGS